MSWRVKRKVCRDTTHTLESARLDDDEDSKSPVRENVWSKIPQCISESDTNNEDASESQSETNEISADLKALHVAKPKKKRKNRKRGNKNGKTEHKDKAEDNACSSLNFENLACGSQEGGSANKVVEDHSKPTERIREKLLENAPEFRSLKIVLRILNPPAPSKTRRHCGTRMQLVSGGEFLTLLENVPLLPGLNMIIYLEEKGLKYFTFKYADTYAVSRAFFLRSPPEENTYYQFQVNEFLLENIIKSIGLTTEESKIDHFLDGALYQIERSFHKDFNLTNLNIRFPYGNIENRSFLILLFLRVLQFEKKGTYRNALEICKLAINFDHSDPLLFILLIDYFALESKEFSWFVEFVKEWIRYQPIEWMPNILYSMALAHYRTGMATGGDLSAAEFYVKKGLLTYPMVLLPLLRNCGLKKSLNQHQELIGSKFFNEFDTNMSPVVVKLCEIYYKGTFKVWISEKPLKWLMKNAIDVLDMVDKKHKDVELYGKIREKVQHTIPLSLKRHIYLNKLLSDFTDHTETCPWNPYPPHTPRDIATP